MKKRIVFLPLPPGIKKKLDGGTRTAFPFRADIPIPVEITEDCGSATPENLTIETILSGMLRAIEERQIKQEWIDYYCGFVLFLRPEIIGRLKEITDNGFEPQQSGRLSYLDDESYVKSYSLITEGRAEEGLKNIHGFIERRPLVWNGWFLLGWALRLLGRWKDGMAAFRKAIELGGGGSDTRNELAICMMETGDTSGARCELETALANDPENVKIISNLGVLALRSGEEEKAAAFFRTALELDSEDPIAKNYFNG
jgi:tetratricopeptide (TPR) repeat protein